jgi:hypothetical protein
MRRTVNLVVIVVALAVAYAIWKPLLGGQPFGPPRRAPATGPSTWAASPLNRPMPQINFVNSGLHDVLDFLSDVTGLSIRVEWDALRAAGVEPDARVSAKLQSAKTTDALAAILESASKGQGKIGVVPYNTTILITSQSRIDSGIVCNSYDVRDFFPDVFPPGPSKAPLGLYLYPGSPAADALRSRVDAVAKSIQDSVGRETWKSNGGLGRIDTRETDGQLIIYNTPAVQDQVERHLEWRRWSRGAKAFAWRVLALLAGSLPVANLALTAIRRVRQHRRDRNLCEACGYDLRASPDRCPECGTVRAPAEHGEGSSKA